MGSEGMDREEMLRREATAFIGRMNLWRQRLEKERERPPRYMYSPRVTLYQPEIPRKDSGLTFKGAKILQDAE